MTRSDDPYGVPFGAGVALEQLMWLHDWQTDASPAIVCADLRGEFPPEWALEFSRDCSFETARELQARTDGGRDVEETPLPGQQWCVCGSLCSGRSTYCSKCGHQLQDDEDDVDVEVEVETDGGQCMDDTEQCPACGTEVTNPNPEVDAWFCESGTCEVVMFGPRGLDTDTDQLETDGGRDLERGREAFLAGDVHWCDLCDRPFDTIDELANHDCRSPRTDGGFDLFPADVNVDDLVGATCPICDEEMTPGAIRNSGFAWEHKSAEAHPQAGHHMISEFFDDRDDDNDDSPPIAADGSGVPMIRKGGTVVGPDPHAFEQWESDRR